MERPWAEAGGSKQQSSSDRRQARASARPSTTVTRPFRSSTVTNVSTDRVRNFASTPMRDFFQGKISDCGGCPVVSAVNRMFNLKYAPLVWPARRLGSTKDRLNELGRHRPNTRRGQGVRRPSTIANVSGSAVSDRDPPIRDYFSKKTKMI
jgi:hypothetical protein